MLSHVQGYIILLITIYALRPPSSMLQLRLTLIIPVYGHASHCPGLEVWTRSFGASC